MLRTAAFTTALLVSSCLAGNAREIATPSNSGNVVRSAVSAGVHELMSLVTTVDATNESALPTDSQAAPRTVIQREPSSRSMALTTPEPGTFILFGAGFVLVGLVRRLRTAR